MPPARKRASASGTPAYGPTRAMVASISLRTRVTLVRGRAEVYTRAMKILYGVVGEGMGHAIRSRVVLDHLLEQGHEVEIMASSRAADFLGKRFAEVHEIHGLHIIYEENRARIGRSLVSNVLSGAVAMPQQLVSYFRLIEDFSPEVVISDFESWAYFYAKLHRLPILSIDNMQVINRCWHEAELLEGIRPEFELARAFVKSKLPFCDQYLITTFLDLPLRKEYTRLVPPVLRPEILRTKPSSGQHLLVYQTAEGHSALPEALAGSGMECRIYGLRRGLTEEQIEGNLRYRPFDEATFISDMASARAVISGGSFTVMSECVYLHKPLLSVPVRGQIEQVLNARYLERVGYGLAAEHVDGAVLDRFVAAISRCEQRLKGYTQAGNRVLFDALTEFLNQAESGQL
jgi:uncharacterized protein (TIGR00661 family)